MTKDIRCPQCGHQGEWQYVMQLNQCPSCSTRQFPLRIAEDGFIKTNWHDIRMLCIYAQRFCATFDESVLGNKTAIETINRIVKEMSRFQPPNAPDLNPALDHPQIAKDIADRKQGDLKSPYLLDLINRENDDNQQ